VKTIILLLTCFILLSFPAKLLSFPQSPDTSNNVKIEYNRISALDYVSKSLIMLFKFYQANITDIDDQTCPMFPSCSNYALHSVEKYGFIIGSLKAFDRLHRCSHDLQYYKIISNENRNSYWDQP